MMSQPDDKQQSSTARKSKDSMGLGPTGGQRSAEILAGLRASLNPSPETDALSRFAGRIMARMIHGLLRFGSEDALNFVALRPAVFAKFIAEHIQSTSQTDEKLTVVELAAGFSARALKMAQDYPDVDFIEIDLPEVIQQKQRRIQSDYTGKIPENLTWIGADLGVETLSDVLNNRPVDVITMEGLTAYFTPEHNTNIVQNARHSLKPGGICVADVPWQVGMDADASRSSISLFSRQAGNFLTIVDDVDGARDIFVRAGYTDINVYEPNTLVAEIPDIDGQVIPFSLFVVASFEGDNSSDSEAETD